MRTWFLIACRSLPWAKRFGHKAAPAPRRGGPLSWARTAWLPPSTRCRPSRVYARIAERRPRGDAAMAVLDMTAVTETQRGRPQFRHRNSRNSPSVLLRRRPSRKDGILAKPQETLNPNYGKRQERRGKRVESYERHRKSDLPAEERFVKSNLNAGIIPKCNCF